MLSSTETIVSCEGIFWTQQPKDFYHGDIGGQIRYTIEQIENDGGGGVFALMLNRWPMEILATGRVSFLMRLAEIHYAEDR